MTTSMLNAAAGIYLIKAGSVQLNELSEIKAMAELRGQILDIPLFGSVDKPLTLGYFALQPSVDYEAMFTFLEVKIVTKGKMVVRDKDNQKFVAEVGDVLVFSGVGGDKIGMVMPCGACTCAVLQNLAQIGRQ